MRFEVFKLEKDLYYFKLGEVSFLFDEFYKEKILPQMKTVDDHDAYIFLFRETIAKKLSEHAYYLKADFFFDTIVVKRKRKLDLKEVNCWFNVLKEEYGKLSDIGFDNIFSNTEEGLTVFVFRNDKHVIVRKTMLDGGSKLIRFY